MKIYILGGEGNGLVIGATLERIYTNAQLLFLNDVDEIGKELGRYKTIPVIGRTEQIEEYLKEEDSWVLSAYGGFTNPQKTLERLRSLPIPDEKWLIAVDPTAVIPEGYCFISKDTFVGPLAQLSANVYIGRHCSLFGNSFVGHDSTIDDFCHIASNSVIGSNVTVGEGTHIGLNCCVRERIKIGKHCIVGAGAVVVKDVPDNAVVVGNPARIIKYRGE